MFNFRRKRQRHKDGQCCCQHKQKVAAPDGCMSLTDAPEDKKLIVHSNSDIKTMEMGLYPGSMITLLNNESEARNIMVKIQDHRYVIPREIAEQIFVKK